MDQSGYQPYVGEGEGNLYGQPFIPYYKSSGVSPPQVDIDAGSIQSPIAQIDVNKQQSSFSSVPIFVASPVSTSTNPYPFGYPIPCNPRITPYQFSDVEMNVSTRNSYSFIPNSAPSSIDAYPYPLMGFSNPCKCAPVPTDYSSVVPMKGIKRPLQENPSEGSTHTLTDTNAAKILCQLGKPQAMHLNNSFLQVDRPDGDPLYMGKNYGHVICCHCHKRNSLQSSNPPPVIQCYSCGAIFPVVKRFIHDYEGDRGDDHSLELPFLRGIKDACEREKQTQLFLQSVIVGRRCNYSSSLRDIQRLVSGMVARVDKLVTKEQRHIDEECKNLMDSLLIRVDQYLQGDLHCCCFQPAYPQRHFIQCDLCNLWFHTSCVGIDSRKLATTASFCCPWCTRDQSIQAKNEVEFEKECICPFCKRTFPRPCNLSRHLHAKHNMKWNTHRMLHVDVDDYLEMSVKSKHSYRNVEKRELFAGCFIAEGALLDYEMNLSHFRFLLRKLRAKPSQWWVSREIRIWDESRDEFRLAVIKCIRPRSEFCIQYRDGTSILISNLFSPLFRIRLLILNGYFELELFRALPSSHIRDVTKDLALFV